MPGPENQVKQHRHIQDVCGNCFTWEMERDRLPLTTSGKMEDRDNWKSRWESWGHVKSGILLDIQVGRPIIGHVTVEFRDEVQGVCGYI